MERLEAQICALAGRERVRAATRGSTAGSTGPGPSAGRTGPGADPASPPPAQVFRADGTTLELDDIIGCLTWYDDRQSSRKL